MPMRCQDATAATPSTIDVSMLDDYADAVFFFFCRRYAARLFTTFQHCRHRCRHAVDAMPLMPDDMACFRCLAMLPLKCYEPLAFAAAMRHAR